VKTTTLTRVLSSALLSRANSTGKVGRFTDGYVSYVSYQETFSTYVLDLMAPEEIAANQQVSAHESKPEGEIRRRDK
jgi:uncharacterized protein YdbL (DUF1318 family)